jgi:GAF domain-containing protein
MSKSLPSNRRQHWRLPEPDAPAADPAHTEVALLRDLIHSLLRAEHPEEAYQFALDRTCPVVGATLASVFVVDGASELMRLAAQHAWPDRWRPWLGEMRVRVGFGPSGESVSERRVIEVADVFADPGLEDWQEVARELGFRAIVSLPLITTARVEGAATFYFASPGVPGAGTRTLLRAVADVMSVVAEKGLLRDQLRRAEAAIESALDEHTRREADRAGEGAPPSPE